MEAGRDELERTDPGVLLPIRKVYWSSQSRSWGSTQSRSRGFCYVWDSDNGGISQTGRDILPATVAYGADGFFEAQILRIQSTPHNHARKLPEFLTVKSLSKSRRAPTPPEAITGIETAWAIVLRASTLGPLRVPSRLMSV